MIPTLAAAVFRTLGVTGCVALGIVVFYEGLPLGPLRHIPLLGPGLEQLVDGRVDRAFRDGEISERLAWQEKQRRALNDEIEREKARQDALDEIALKYRQEQANGRALAEQISGLEEELAKGDTDGDGTGSGSGADTRSFIPRGVSRKLDAIGRRYPAAEGAHRP